jgi:nucleotide-binding universal stress UspA family protein
MSTMRSFLVGIDFSDDSRRAAGRAAVLAGEQGARLDLLHVMSGPSLASLRELFGSAAAPEAALVADAQRMLNDLARELADKSGTQASAHVKVGHVLDEILAASERADMLVLGARGLNPLRELMLGTTADRLVKKCSRPVLVTKRPPQHGYRQVLVPVDFSPHSVAALGTAIVIAPKAELMVVHAFEVPFEGKLWLAGVAEEEIHRYRGQARQRALGNIAALIRDVGGERYRFLSVVDHGDATRVILAKEEESGAELVVMGKHGQSIVEELLLGSVTHHVLSQSRCDVLVVPGRAVAASA